MKLPEALRKLARETDPGPAAAHYVLLHDAADKISALASQNEELRGALAAIQNKAHAARPADYGTALAVIAAWAGKELSLPPNAELSGARREEK